MYKFNLSKKDTQIKEQAANQLSYTNKLTKVEAIQSDNADLREKLNKLKIEIDRKDSLISHLKSKNQ